MRCKFGKTAFSARSPSSWTDLEKHKACNQGYWLEGRRFEPQHCKSSAVEILCKALNPIHQPHLEDVKKESMWSHFKLCTQEVFQYDMINLLFHYFAVLLLVLFVVLCLNVVFRYLLCWPLNHGSLFVLIYLLLKTNKQTKAIRIGSLRDHIRNKKYWNPETLTSPSPFPNTIPLLGISSIVVNWWVK